MKTKAIGWNYMPSITTEMEIWVHKHHGELDEAMKFLKSLNQLTGDMMEFMKQHNLRSAIEIN